MGYCQVKAVSGVSQTKIPIYHVTGESIPCCFLHSSSPRRDGRQTPENQRSPGVKVVPLVETSHKEERKALWENHNGNPEMELCTPKLCTLEMDTREEPKLLSLLNYLETAIKGIKDTTEVPPEQSKDFLRKVYSILTVQIMLTTVTSALFMSCDPIKNFVHSSPAVVLIAALGSLGLIVALSIYRLQHPTNLYLLLGFLFFHSDTMDLLFSAAGALVFCGFIIYDTHLLMHKLSPEEYILASINLYLDIINLFLHLLRLLEAMKKN
ncbi:LFG4 protein, partial [Polypterus senegalus]